MKTLVIVSHPYFSQSRAIHALQETAEAAENVTVRNLETLYGDSPDAIDVAAEQAAYANADRVVFLYPTHWFNLTPMLKAYLNAVWTYGWAFGPGGEALKDKQLQIVTTAGASEFTYSHDGLLNSTMEEVLTPMKASARYVGMRYRQPLAFYEVAARNKDKLSEFQTRFAAELRAA
ncbi:NAD(P)H-dependent oxidoreductase [Kluyvera ascorbata]|jgi:glutathione-regulated potassium-efflux system ancillary protein KefF|uniref:NAD(P)H-dependent oxidoreductase n=1 Tax=Kluyvera ascorbata TaxID=51288 RepID=A0AB35X2R8_9ENTR|nr:NAD(P)H-dependent oxidoreductase [Kluyvera ascorbata]HEB4876039.1 NAD(P)H-dependent oxidoreductase [Kluyvera ascorbata F0526]EJG2387972.1 NAD(P)H-dependent oxidoreductase [Kluyvera ascorbata]KFC99138.1 NAD(P)H oxidoreductase/putative NADPH-quinone reductase/flavodoxin 2 [Kluyvera ascorbata ATCC 33433]MDU1197561.1 NAD(P)H-dependent oxidoreductase [Kluyvera ascorbata]STW99098.1 General stress protein 14 [Kluyvera ascorbata]